MFHLPSDGELDEALEVVATLTDWTWGMQMANGHGEGERRTRDGEWEGRRDKDRCST